MKIRIGNGLWLLNLAVFGLVIAIFFCPSNVVRVILALPFALFFPGYALLLALFPRRAGISAAERVALSFGMSIAILPLIGLILNYTPWGIRLEPVLYSVASFTFATSLTAWFRYRGLPKQERFEVEFQLKVPGWSGGPWDKALSVILAVAVFGGVATFVYVGVAPKVGERFTEFYILGAEGTAAYHPTALAVGEGGKVTVGIINREHEPVTYHLEVRIDGVKVNEVPVVNLANDEKWEGEVSFTPIKASEGQKVEFLLYKDGQSEAYQSVHFWVSVEG